MQIPITIVTGFLGSGKTTLVNRILRENSHKRIGLLLNEFGNMALESEFIQEGNTGIIEFEGGCLCHAPTEKIVEALRNILSLTSKIEHIVIEASGLTNPLPVMQLLHSPRLTDQVYLDSVICVVDPVNFPENRKHHLLMQGQLLYANYVVLSKTDIAESEQVEYCVNELLQLAADLHIIDSRDLESTRPLLEQSQPGQIDFSDSDHEEHDGHEHDHFHQHLFSTELPVNRYILTRTIERAPAEILRVKGVVYIQGDRSHKFVIHKVGSQLNVEKVTRKQTDDGITKVLAVGVAIPPEFRRELELAVEPPGKPTRAIKNFIRELIHA